jgi:hypothetical protein
MHRRRRHPRRAVHRRPVHRRPVALVVAVALATGVAACTDDSSDDATDASLAPALELAGTAELTLPDPDRCEHFDAGGCLLPWPSNHFTRPDDTADTGMRVDLEATSMPTNVSGTPVDPTEWNRDDGFSPGGPIVLRVDGLDLDRTGAPPITDLGASLAGDSPIVLVDMDTGERRPFWAETDANAPPGEGVLFLRPAVNLTEGHRHAVALRDLRTADGTTIAPSPAFVAYRDQLGTDVPEVEERRGAMEEVFAALDEVGVDRDDLYLAWDFTVASTRGITGRAVAMRDLAFDALAGAAPSFDVSGVEDNPDPAGQWSRTVQGTVEVPSFLTDDGGPGTVLNNADDPDGIPSQNGTLDAPFTCVLPGAPTGSTPAPVTQTILYGHGLLGSRAEAEGVGKAAAGTLGSAVCAVDWIGMSGADAGPIAAMLADLSGFRIIPDRLQQSFVNFLVLGRAVTDPGGFAADPAFSPGGAPGLGAGLVFVGTSQGGILGGALSALTDQWTQVFLGVPGMNYATLLQRSIDFAPFAPLLYSAYPNPVDQQLLFALIQQLWDRAENDGYAAHVTADPLPGSVAKEVLIFAAFGDHQVANVTTDVLARTLGASVRTPALAPARSTDVVPFWGLGTVTLPSAGPATYVMWDFGTPPPPTTNTPPTEGEDPHGKGRTSPRVLELVGTFLRSGTVPEVCDTGPCQGES